LATGGEARSLPGVAPDRDRIFVIRSTQDADALRTRLSVSSHLMVIGGGWLGLEVAATARKAGLEVDVIEAADRLCARAASPELAARLADLHRRAGVRLHLGVGLSHLDCRPDGVSAQLNNGAAITADCALLAVGLVPSTDLALRAGLAVNDGVLVDWSGRSSDPAIFAIGDCARFEHPILARSVRLESWQNANHSAERAALAICGLDPPAAEAPWFWSDQHGRSIQIVGETPDDATLIERGSPDAPVTLYLKGGRLVGVAAIDAAREIGVARKLVADRASLDAIKAADRAISLRSAVAL
jgi:3-phenylpropionate/trans-cinnamate dioxygenase ferredoxin reductase subunit